MLSLKWSSEVDWDAPEYSLKGDIQIKALCASVIRQAFDDLDTISRWLDRKRGRPKAVTWIQLENRIADVGADIHFFESGNADWWFGALDLLPRDVEMVKRTFLAKAFQVEAGLEHLLEAKGERTWT